MRVRYLALCLCLVLGLAAAVRDHSTLRSALRTQGETCSVRPLDAGIGISSDEVFELGSIPERREEAREEYDTQKKVFESKFCQYLLQYGDKDRLHGHLRNKANKLYSGELPVTSTKEDAKDWDPITRYFIGNLRTESPNNKYGTPEFRGHNVEAAAKLYLAYGFESGILQDCSSPEMEATIGVANRVESCLEAAFHGQWQDGFEVLDESMMDQITTLVGAMDCTPDSWLLQCADTDISRIQKLMKARATANYNPNKDEFRCFTKTIKKFSDRFISAKSTRGSVYTSCIKVVERYCHREEDFGPLAFSICGEIVNEWGEYVTAELADASKSKIVETALFRVQVAKAEE